MHGVLGFWGTKITRIKQTAIMLAISTIPIFTHNTKNAAILIFGIPIEKKLEELVVYFSII